MDAFDIKILAALQRDASLSIAQLADEVGLSSTPCWRRLQALEKSGVIRQRVALVDAEKIGVGVIVWVRLRTDDHSAAWVTTFRQAVEDMPEVVGVYRLSGDIDYLLKIVVPDIAGYDAVYQRLIHRVRFSDVSANFSMETVKETTALPTNYVA